MNHFLVAMSSIVKMEVDPRMFTSPTLSIQVENEHENVEQGGHLSVTQLQDICFQLIQQFYFYSYPLYPIVQPDKEWYDLYELYVVMKVKHKKGIPAIYHSPHSDTEESQQIWSFGCLLFELLTNVNLAEYNDIKLVHQARELEYHSEEERMVTVMMQHCLQINPRERISKEELYHALMEYVSE